MPFIQNTIDENVQIAFEVHVEYLHVIYRNVHLTKIKHVYMKNTY